MFSGSNHWYRLRQCPLIYFLVLIQRDSVNLHCDGRHHVWRFLVEDEIVQRFNVDLFIADDVCGYKLAARSLFVESLHSGILDAGELADDCLNFFQFDTETAYLHLSVAATHELYVAIRQEAHNVASAIDTGIFFVVGKRIADVNLCCFLGAVQISTAHLWAAHPQLTCGTYWQPTALRVDNVQAHIVERGSDGDVVPFLVYMIGGGEDCTFRRAIDVVELIALRRGDAGQFLSSCREAGE